MKRIPSVSYNYIANYRSELMGIAMLNVLVLHFISYTGFNHPIWASSILNIFGRLLFTEIFLFLSGFGIYYSFHKNSSIRSFYLKRTKRFLVPYWIMTLPFFVGWFISGEIDAVGVLTRFSTLEFWLNGYNTGRWYESVTVFLYLCFPIIYKCLQKRGGVLFMLMLIIIVITALYYCLPDYYNKTDIGIVKIPFFIIGAWVGKQSIEDRRISIIYIGIMVLALVLLYIRPVCSWLSVREGVFRLVGLILSCVLLFYTKEFVVFHRVLQWIGQYTLELYILHTMIFSALPNDFANGYVKSFIAIGGAFIICMPVQKICTCIVSFKK